MSTAFSDNQIADKLIAAHDGDVALLYIFLRRNGNADLEKAASALCRTMAEINSAREKLQRAGLLDAVPTPPPAEPEADVLPQYTAEEISRRSSNDEGFTVIVDEARRIMNRPIGVAELKVLFGIYDYLGMPPEVVLELLNYCYEVCREKYGSERWPTARFLEKEAYAWAKKEILTLEQAEEYIKTRKSRWEDCEKIKAAMGIRDRGLSATEIKYIEAWLELGFDTQAVVLAFDRTVGSIGSLKWPYMNKILLSWHEKKLHTPREIEEGDSRRSSTAAAPAGENKNIGELIKGMDKI